MGFILSIISKVLFFIVAIINPVVVIITYSKSHGFFKTVNNYFKASAKDLDIYGNYTYRATWNLFFKKKKGYRFGNKTETISSALGKNQQEKTLTIIGWIIVMILWFIDYKYWFKGGHAFNAIKKTV